MKIRIPLCLDIVLAGIVIAPTMAQSPSAAVTFHREILPILQERCQSCHRAGEVAPMALGTYQEVQPWAGAIKQAVLARRMPPWNADSSSRKFLNDPSLSREQIELITTWIDNGAAEGDPNDAPPPRSFTQGWNIGPPDVVYEVPEVYTVPEFGTIPYTYVIIPSNFTEDRWVAAAEVRTQAPSVLHHANVYVREPESKWLRDYAPNELFVPTQTGPSGFDVSLREQHLVGYIPGRPAKQMRPGYALLVPAGSDLVLQLHYSPNGKVTTDQSRVGLVFAEEAPSKRVIRLQAANPFITIPPGDPNHEVSAAIVVQVDTELLDAYPHMHYRGKSMVLSAVHPDGAREELVRIPRYNFHWQLVYEFRDPVQLRTGTRLRADAVFDNSAANPMNPDPKAEVRWGDQAWEEMMIGFFDIAVDVDTDPNSTATWVVP